MSTTERKDASSSAEKLRAKGYDAYVIEADLKGKIWYRVRVGSFSARQDAEALRVALYSKEGLRDAFLAANSKSEVFIALNRDE